MSDSPALLLGPLLRRVVDHKATIWVQTAHAGTVTVLASPANRKMATIHVNACRSCFRMP